MSTSCGHDWQGFDGRTVCVLCGASEVTVDPVCPGCGRPTDECCVGDGCAPEDYERLRTTLMRIANGSLGNFSAAMLAKEALDATT